MREFSEVKLKRVLLLGFIGSFVFVGFVRAQERVSESEYALKADEKFREGKFHEALSLYGELQYPSANAYANMGSCAFQLGDFAKALWRWRQAEKRWGFSGRWDLYQNLDLVRQKLSGPTKEKLPTLQCLQDGLQRKCRSIPLVVMQLIFLLLWAFLFLYVRKLLKFRRKKTLLGLFCLVVACGGFLVYRHNLLSHTYAVVLEASSDLYSGPALTYQKIGQLKEGDEVRVEAQERDFYKVGAHGWSGWIARGKLGII